MSDFRKVDGSVMIEPEIGGVKLHPIYMIGDIPFIFVKLPSGAMTHLLPDGRCGTSFKHQWRGLRLGEAYRVDQSDSVVSAIDIARETAKRLGVEK